MDLFVVNRHLHLFFRVTAIFFGIIIYLRGKKYNDNILKVIGILTIIVDSFTTLKSIEQIINGK